MQRDQWLLKRVSWVFIFVIYLASIIDRSYLGNDLSILELSCNLPDCKDESEHNTHDHDDYPGTEGRGQEHGHDH